MVQSERTKLGFNQGNFLGSDVLHDEVPDAPTEEQAEDSEPQTEEIAYQRKLASARP